VYDSYTNTLMYFYDHLRESRSGTVELYEPDATRFAGYGPNVTKVIIDPSMKDAAMTTMKNLFYGGSGDNTKLSAMTTIEGLENLNISRVKSTERMFYGCSALTTLDLTSFSVANVEDMRNMFVSCTNLATIYCNDDWSSTTAQSSGMFTSCGSLVGGNGTEYASGNSDANYARPDDPDNDKPGYFTIKGDVYTVYDATTKTLTYRYDGHYDESNQYHELYDPSATSATRFVDYHDQVLRAVVDPTMKKAPLTSLEKMFYGGWKSGALGLSAMKTVEGLENLNTAIVTNMNRMFINCSALETIDISSFDVCKLKYTDYMFSDCTSLKTIYCDGDWSVLGLANSGRMFSGCTSLVGGKGTLFDSSKDDASYARPDGGTSSPGYFTITKTEVSATIGETEWATFVAPYALDFGGVDGLTAYIVTGYSGSTVETTEVYDVPANTPVLLNGSADTYTIPVIGGSMTDVSSNKLVAGTGAAVEAEAGKTKYVLSASDGKAVFKKINETPATVAWGKAYLMFDGVVEARQLVFDNETGINEQPLSSLPRGGELYNLQGQRIVTSHKGENGSGLPKGLYIVNGKKVIVK
jgi:surface protein